MENKTAWTEDMALSHLRRWCAAQDRCQSEVRTKLIEHRVYGLDLEHIISTLVSEGFINEERFARNYCRGKFRMNHWGKIKILQGLKFFQISDNCIKKGLSEIDENEYIEMLNQLISKKWENLKLSKTPETRKKILSYALQKGYEPQIIQECTHNLFKT